jgi:L-cysteine/cystine lyase
MRDAFPVLRHTAYLNAGTFGPLAQQTVDALRAQAADELEHGRGGRAYFERLLELRARIRAAIASLLHTVEDRVALTSSTTHGCQVVLSGLGIAPGDEIVTTDEEHFGLLGPLHASGATVRVVETRGHTAERALEAILGATGPRTRLLAISHVSWITGHVLPVDDLKAHTAIPLLVDGAQSVGAIPVRATADFYTVSGQKWLCGPDATGALYVAEPDRLAVALPTYWSQEHHEQDGSFEPAEGARRFDAAMIPLPSLAGLDTALGLAPSSRYDDARTIAERCRQLLAERFEVVTAPGQATLVTFRPGDDPAETVKRLLAARVVVRELPGTGWVRVSCGYWTNEDDLDRLLAALP